EKFHRVVAEPRVERFEFAGRGGVSADLETTRVFGQRGAGRDGRRRGRVLRCRNDRNQREYGDKGEQFEGDVHCDDSPWKTLGYASLPASRHGGVRTSAVNRLKNERAHHHASAPICLNAGGNADPGVFSSYQGVAAPYWKRGAPKDLIGPLL